MKRCVIAIGGNSIVKSGGKGTLNEQFANIYETGKHIAGIIEKGYDIVITHGNGPQVGDLLYQSELAEHALYPVTLDICDSYTQGSIGYMLQQTLGNIFRTSGINKEVVTVVTQVIVDKNDSAFRHPTKPIGPFYTHEKAKKYKNEKGWVVIEDAGRGYRRVVPSPRPVEIVEKNIIKKLIDDGFVVIAVGGGGVPVIRERDGTLKGVEAVVDKDLASSLLATELRIETFLISTDVDKVSLYYNTPEQKDIDRMTVSEAKKYLHEGHFADGSMKPKIEASIEFLERGGKRVIITSPTNIENAIDSFAGTVILP